ncbi:MAG: prepilin-type N-terminal cleavage/methylation domain-containing protein [Pontibacterium sp.]
MRLYCLSYVRTVKGFTLVELVAVLVLLSILSAAVFSRLPDTGSYQDAVLRDSLINSLRLSQRSALSHHAAATEWQLTHPIADQWQYAIRVSSANQLTEETMAATTLNYRGGSSLGTFNRNMAVGDTVTLRYDSLGNITHLDDGTLYPLNTSITLSFSGKTICVALSGYAYAGSCP